MAVETHIYDEEFFKNTRTYETASAKAFTDIIAHEFSFNSIIDIGCGVGIYLKEFAAMGKEISGYDGAPAAVEGSLVGDKIKLHDLTTPLRLDQHFDLALCIEVAEHLPPEAASVLVDSMVSLSDTIIFTAAIPGQGDRGIGHINEQPHRYWIDLFAERGYAYNKEVSEDTRHKLKAAGVIWWIVQNFMTFKKAASPLTAPQS